MTADKVAELIKENSDKQVVPIIENDTMIEMTDDEKIDFVAERILRKYRRAFEELAK